MNEEFPQEDEEQYVSKSQRKRECHALQDMGEKLVELSSEQLAKMPLDDALRNAVLEAQRIRQRGGRKRQLQYIGKLMRKVDAEPIREALARLEQNHAATSAAHHRLERWRDRLIEEGDAALAELLEALPQADRQQLRQLVRNAQRERQQGKPAKTARELFRYLRSLFEA